MIKRANSKGMKIMKNIYDIAYDLEKTLREEPAFLELKKAYEAVKTDEEASALFTEFTSMQQEIQAKQMSGEDLTDEYIAQAQDVAGRATTNEWIQKMMTSEQQLSVLIEDINKIIIKPLQEMYAQDTPANEQE